MAESHFSRKFRARALEAIRQTEESLGLGQAVDYPKYREQVGLIQGLMVALGICDDLDKEEG